jgi:hypothetical protein
MVKSHFLDPTRGKQFHEAMNNESKSTATLAKCMNRRENESLQAAAFSKPRVDIVKSK